MSTLIRLVGIYRLGDKNVHIYPLDDLRADCFNNPNVYKITTYFGERQKFDHRHKAGKKNNFRFKIVEKIATFYLGKEVQRELVGSVKYRDFKEGDETMFIRLKNGDYMEVSDRYEVIDADDLADGVKFSNLFDPSFCVSIGK